MWPGDAVFGMSDEKEALGEARSPLEKLRLRTAAEGYNTLREEDGEEAAPHSGE